jgi:hypothetical protein
MVGRHGLEPRMPEAADLQSAGLTNSPNDPYKKRDKIAKDVFSLISNNLRCNLKL